MIKMHTIFVAAPAEEDKLEFAKLIIEYDNLVLEFYQKVGRLARDSYKVFERSKETL